MGKTFVKIIASLIVCAVVIYGLNIALTFVTNSADESLIKSVNDAVARAAVSCYAIEGAYPQELDYLVEHYGLILNEDKYVVHYGAFASNVMPEIAVIPITREGK